MSFIKLINEKDHVTYDTEASVENLIYYIYDICKTTYDHVRPGNALGDHVGCSYFFGTQEQMLLPECIVAQMLANNRAYGKIEGDLIKHRMISFDEIDRVMPYEAFRLARYIANAYGERYITAFGVHLDTKNIHIHLAVDTISWRDGKRFSISYEWNWLHSMLTGWEKARDKIFMDDEREWEKRSKYYGEG